MLLRKTCLVLWLVVTGALAQQPHVVIYIPDAMPLASTDPNGHGLVGDAALEAIKRAGYQAVIKSEPWLRAQKNAREGRNILLIPLSRTPAREEQYTWIATILPLPRAFFTFTEPVQTFEQARLRYQRIGVGIGTAQEEILRSQGFRADQIYSLQLGEKPIRLLELNRIDAWFTTVPEGQYDWARSNSKALLRGPEMATTEMYLACSKACDEKLVTALRRSVAALRADGSIARIRARYLGLPTQ
ncbi:substrate-binding periplasmic protein [Pseudomonas turukhanskensis]|uniref:ABC transporter substrate-binding protein n=1 Tax=Pseudomonas turukhanskensis TaxID=1806536 RepID=A0A9W6K9Y4_9PSED|nr:transporter substrate-binding domain-containing protein [Pseudomonas turukhanskensis]GLK90843.1 ABC transporter substrate-binding protein [Pseudomonas turukhanskensis]